MSRPEQPPATAETRVLVVDDEPQLVRGLTIVLRTAGYVVELARTASEALGAVAEHPPDALLLDLARPDREGLEVCSEVRRFSSVPILIMSAVGAERAALRALDAGADDYLPMPFRGAELVARLNRLLVETVGMAGAARLEIGEVIIDLVRRRVTRAGAVLLLEPAEFELVRVLAQRPGRLVTDGQLLRAVWGDDCRHETRRLRVGIARLRAKLERDPSRPAYLIADPGIGYRLASRGEVAM